MKSKFRNLFDPNRDGASERLIEGVWVVEPQGETILVTPSTLMLAQANAAAEIEACLLDRTLPEDAGTVREWLAATGPELRSFEFRLRNHEGHVQWISATASRPSTSDRVVVRTLRDTTPSKKAEECLRASEQRFRRVFASAAVGMSISDLHRKFLEANDALLSLLGYTIDELRGTTALAIIHPEDVAANLERLDQLLSGQISGFIIEKRYIRKDGSQVWVRNSESLLPDNAGKPAFIAAVTEDLTAAKRTEDRLREVSGRLLQSQDEERRRLARELHDSTVQNLAGALASLSVVDRADLGPKHRKSLNDVAALIEQSYGELRTISYLLHPPLLDEIGLPGALRWYVRGHEERTELGCELTMPEDLDRLPQEIETTIFRIVQESLANIHRHSCARKCRIEIAFGHESVVLRIHDDGQGIPEAVLQRIYAGAWLGVGLVGMRERVHQLGGEFALASDSSGTTVQAILPLK